MKVILFGGAGYIGTHVALSFLERGDEVGIYDNLSTGLESNVSPDAKFYLGDILDRDRVREVLSEGWDVAVHLAAFKAAGESMVKPEKYSAVINCAAYTAVDKAEEDSENAMLVNAFGTENIAEFCGKNDIALVYISTDYVFDGEKKEPYKPDDNTNPLNVYGLSKLKGEEAVQKYCRKFYIVRTSWLYGHHGRNFAETIITKALEGQELKVVDDQIGCPTWTADLASGIVVSVFNCSFLFSSPSASGSSEAWLWGILDLRYSTGFRILRTKRMVLRLR